MDSPSVHRSRDGVYWYGAIGSSPEGWRIPAELKHNALGTAARDAISWVFGCERGRPSIRPSGLCVHADINGELLPLSPGSPRPRALRTIGQ